MRVMRLTVLQVLFLLTRATPADVFDAAPFALPLPEGKGLMWEDPREIHQVIVHFTGPAPASERVRLEYWGSRWPEQHLPKDKQPGGADVGWMELGNWYTGNWRIADAEAESRGSTVTFTFRDVSAKEFPALKDYSVRFRFTLKLRISSDAELPKIERIEALTDSNLRKIAVRLEWKDFLRDEVKLEAFNGRIETSQKLGPRSLRFEVQAASNKDPNTFDRTL